MSNEHTPGERELFPLPPKTQTLFNVLSVAHHGETARERAERVEFALLKMCAELEHASMPVAPSDPAHSDDARRFGHIEAHAVRGSIYKGITSINVIVYDKDLRQGARYAIDRMIERQAAAIAAKADNKPAGGK
jgi:hypothetical protein